MGVSCEQTGCGLPGSDLVQAFRDGGSLPSSWTILNLGLASLGLWAMPLGLLGLGGSGGGDEGVELRCCRKLDLVRDEM